MSTSSTYTSLSDHNIDTVTKTYLDVLPPELILNILSLVCPRYENKEHIEIPFANDDVIHDDQASAGPSIEEQRLAGIYNAWPGSRYSIMTEPLLYARVTCDGNVERFCSIIDAIIDQPGRRYWCQCLEVDTKKLTIWNEETSLRKLNYTSESVYDVEGCGEEGASWKLQERSKLQAYIRRTMDSLGMQVSDVEQLVPLFIDQPQSLMDPTEDTSKADDSCRAYRIRFLLSLFPNLRTLSLSRGALLAWKVPTVVDFFQNLKPKFSEHGSSQEQSGSNGLKVPALLPEDILGVNIVSPLIKNIIFGDSWQERIKKRIGYRRWKDRIQYESQNLIWAFFVPTITKLHGTMIFPPTHNSSIVNIPPDISLDHYEKLLPLAYNMDFTSLFGTSSVSVLEFESSIFSNEIACLLRLPKALKEFTYSRFYAFNSAADGLFCPYDIWWGLQPHLKCLERLTISYRGNSRVSGLNQKPFPTFRPFIALKYLLIDYCILVGRPFRITNPGRYSTSRHYPPLPGLTLLPPLLETFILRQQKRSSIRCRECDGGLCQVMFGHILDVVDRKEEIVPGLKNLTLDMKLRRRYTAEEILSMEFMVRNAWENKARGRGITPVTVFSWFR